MDALDQLAQQHNLTNNSPASKVSPLDMIAQQMATTNTGNNSTSAGATGAAQSATDPGAFMAGVENFNRMFGQAAEGVLDLGARISTAMGGANAPTTSWGPIPAGGSTMSDYTKNLDNYSNAMNTSASDAMAKHPVAGTIGAGAGMLAQAVPLGMTGAFGTAADSLASRALTGLATGGSIGFLTAPGDLDKRITGGALGGLLGGLMPVAAKGIGSAIANNPVTGNSGEFSSGLAKLLTPESAAANDVNTVVTAKQGVSDLVEGLVNGDVKATTAKINQGYGALKDVNVPSDQAQTVLSNPSIAERMSTLNNSVDNSLKDLPDTNMAKLAAVSKMIGNELYNSTAQLKDPGLKTLTPGDLPTLMEAKNQINSTLDAAGQDAGVDYQGLRQMAEKKILYNQLTDAISKVPELKGAAPMLDGGVSTQNIGVGKLFDTLVGTQQKQAYFMDAMNSAGVDTDNVKGLITKLGSIDMRNNPVEALLNKTNNESGINPLSQAPSETLTEVAKTFLGHLVNGNYNDHVIDLMLSGPELQSKLSSALSSSTPEFLTQLRGLLKTAAQTGISLSKSPATNAAAAGHLATIPTMSAGMPNP